MQIQIQVKQPGRKQALINRQPIEIDNIGATPTAAALIAAVVSQQVRLYNSKTAEKNLLPFLTHDDTAGQAATGKVGFGSIYSTNKADEAKAIANALQAFDDDMYAIFTGDEEIQTKEQHITLTEATVITFIRLTFLAGSYW